MEVQTSTRPILVALLLSSLFVGISWAALVPMWHTPDEQAHFAQAQDFAAIGYRPNPGDSTPADIVRSEELLGTRRDHGNNKFTYHPEYRIPYSSTTTGIFEDEIRDFPISMRTEFVTNEATGYPPIYYWMIAGVNRLFWDHDLITRVFLSRLATVFLSTIGTFVIFLLSREVLHSSFIALISTALVSFHPMWRFVGSGVTSDALMNIVYPLTVLGLLHLIERPSRRSLLVFLAAWLFSLLTKVQSTFVMIAATPYLFQIMRNPSISRGVRVSIRVCFVVFIVVSTIVLLRHSLLSTSNHPLIVSLRLPELNSFLTMGVNPTISRYIQVTTDELYRQTFPWYWGVYRWLSLTLPLWAYRVIKIVILASLAGWVIALFRRPVSFIVHRSSFIVLLCSSVMYALGLLTWNFFFWKSQGFPIGIQGRYFFPNLPEHMVFLLVGLLLVVPASLRKLSGFVTLILMMTFHWYSLWFVSASYYDTSSLSTFFIQASQYKPWFFKMPYLPVWLFAGIVSSVVFVVLLGYHLLKRPGLAAARPGLKELNEI